MGKVEYLNWELSVLSRAVAYPNLSGASSHVGISQPQLSRIVSKLEEQLQIKLLDREARRRSAWTPVAYRVAEVYGQSLKNFRVELSKLVEGSTLNHVRIGALEGLMPVALQIAHSLLHEEALRTLEFNVQDLNALEESFARRDLDVIFSSREPGRKKYKFVKRIGWQILETQKSDRPMSKSIPVMSSFEYGSQVQNVKNPQMNQVLVSNSLEVRKAWISRFGGVGTIPSDLKREKTGKAGEVPVLMVGGDDLPQSFWAKISEVKV